MALDLPRTLSPSKVAAFTNCPLAFRFSQIEHRPEPPSPHAVKGTLVHAALEGLFWHHAPGARTPAAAQAELDRCWDELQDDDEYVRARRSSADEAAAFLADARHARRQLLPPGGPQRGAGGRDRAGGRDGGRRHAPARHHRPPRRDGRRQPDRRGLQDRAGALGALRARQHGRGPDLRAACARACSVGPRPRSGCSTCASPSPFRRWPRSRPSAASAGGPWPSGPPSSGPATPRTSGPTSAPCATTATSRPPAPPSPRDEPAVSTIDEAVDAAFEPLRGRPEIDRAAAVVSNLADYGLIWVLAGRPARHGGAARTGAAPSWRWPRPGFSSLLVSRVVKAAVERQRPEDHLDASVRTPTSSSFPSGHTLAAFCTAFVLGDSEAGHRRQRRFRHGGGGQPGPPAGPSPHRRHRRRGHRLGARPGPAPDRRRRHARQQGPAGPAARRAGNAPVRGRVEANYEAFRRHLGLPLPLRPQCP